MRPWHFLWLSLLLVGCSRAPAPPRDAVEAGLAYLRGCEAADGGWHSSRYKDMGQGPELTPFVFKALSFGAGQKPERALAYLQGQRPTPELIYPVYTSAGFLLNGLDEDGRWSGHLLSFQATEALGYTPEDPQYGGWSYALEPPKKPEQGELPALSHSNLPSTLFALGGLSVSKKLDADTAAKALKFVQRCQNYPDGDGGFCASASDEAMNKAGEFKSYGSASSDGLRALLRCGSKPDDPRVVAARGWVDSHLSSEVHPGDFPNGRYYDRDSLYFYYCWSTAHALNGLSRAGVELNEAEKSWLKAVRLKMIGLQKPDGSWSNSASATREDDPLVATPMALAVLVLSR
ncbi:MAG: terpene cyclase/mutase family protein [Candidatus Eremiobacteraeota bacterium]|nr:terpene cyclase/mutase family protein [Candidatus Eremiobacteraeota bacterium]